MDWFEFKNTNQKIYICVQKMFVNTSLVDVKHKNSIVLFEKSIIVRTDYHLKHSK